MRMTNYLNISYTKKLNNKMKSTSTPKYYANVIQEKPEDYSNYENLEIEWG